MNADFNLVSSEIKVPVKGEKNKFTIESVLHLTYLDVPLARWQGQSGEPLLASALNYIDTHGYLAEWSRRWKLRLFEAGTEWVQWDESMRVDIKVARREKPRMRKDIRGKWIVVPGDSWKLFIRAWHWARLHE